MKFTYFNPKILPTHAFVYSRNILTPLLRKKTTLSWEIWNNFALLHVFFWNVKTLVDLNRLVILWSLQGIDEMLIGNDYIYTIYRFPEISTCFWVFSYIKYCISYSEPTIWVPLQWKKDESLRMNNIVPTISLHRIHLSQKSFNL